jgi:hypothetical protein
MIESRTQEPGMDDEKFNSSLRKFLRTVGVTSQQEIEKAVQAAISAGRIKGDEALHARMVLTIEAVGLSHTVESDIELD